MSIRKPPTPLPNAFEELDRVQPPRRKKPEAQYADFRQGAEAGDCAETDSNGSGPDFRAGAHGMEDTEKPYQWSEPHPLEDYLSPVLPMRPEMMSDPLGNWMSLIECDARLISSPLLQLP